MLVFRVRSKRTFLPGKWNSDKKFPLTAVKSCPSDKSAAVSLGLDGSSAASPLNAFPYNLSLLILIA